MMATQLSHEKPACDEPPSKRPRIESSNMSETRLPLEAFFRTHGQTPKAEKAQARHEAQARFDARVKAEEQARNERRLQTAQKNEEAANIPVISTSDFVEPPPLLISCDYDIIRKMIDKYLKLQARDKLLNDKIIRGKTSNIIALFASSQDEKVQTILTTAINEADLFDWKHRGSQDFRREWAAAEGSETWKSKSERFLHEYWELYWDETVFKNGFNHICYE